MFVFFFQKICVKELDLFSLLPHITISTICSYLIQVNKDAYEITIRKRYV